MLEVFVFFFNDTATTEIYTLSLHDALPISNIDRFVPSSRRPLRIGPTRNGLREEGRSEEHTSELQSPDHLVCRLLLDKKHHHHEADEDNLATLRAHHRTGRKHPSFFKRWPP